MIFTVILLLLLVSYGMWEFRRHQKNLDAIPLRVLVNGTRGKSSVTRLITGGLRKGRMKILGKTTGTKPRLIYPDGSEHAILRAGKANIIEQLMVFRRAVALGVQAVVTECMAVLPPNQIIMQNQLVRSTVGVITNARADHLDEMGPTVQDVARCLARTIPAGGTVFTAERIQLSVLQEEASARHARLIAVTGDQITDAVMRGFSYIEHKDNVALALAVCESLGVARETALDGMYAAQPDPGALRIFTVKHYQKELSFVNAFAANDPDSYILIWDTLRRYAPRDARIIVIVNCRQDRIQRTESMADLITHRIRADHFVLAGESTLPLYNRSRAMGLISSRILDLGGRTAEEVFQQVVALTETHTLVIGIGNIVGLGEEIVLNFANRGKEVVY
jgi:gamma-polyglutamate synthase